MSRTSKARRPVERLWPRGVRKADLRLDRWLRDVAPSPELREHEDALAPVSVTS